MTTVLWLAALVVAVLWPSHALGPFDGAPLNGIAEAVIVGVVVPALAWLHRAFLQRTWIRVAIVGLIGVRAASAFLPQQGFCARAATSAPLTGEVLTIPVDEPHGFLRS